MKYKFERSFQVKCNHHSWFLILFPESLFIMLIIPVPELRSWVGSFNCKIPRCQICTYVNETDSFISTVTGETYKINHKFDCMEKCLIYLLTCNKCRKQYVGQTVDTFRYRWNNYRSNSRKHAHGISCMQEHLYEHFCDSEHSGFLNDVSITFIDKTDPTNPLQRENYWKHTLKTFAPYGLNIKENV